MDQIKALWRSDEPRLLTSPHTVENVAFVEWEEGRHTHLGLEVMGANGQWMTVGSVALQDCRTPDVRWQLHQFPLFKLVWYGQAPEPSNVPQAGAPEQDSLVRSEATMRP